MSEMLDGRLNMMQQNTLENALSETDRELRQIGDRTRADRSRRAKQSQLEFLGVRVPLMRARLARGFSYSSFPPGDLFDTLEFIWSNSNVYEVMAVPSYFFESHPELATSSFGLRVVEWLPRVDNWCHCDGLGRFLSVINETQSREVMPKLFDLSCRTGIWEQRLALVSMIKHGGKDTFFLPLEEALCIVGNCAGSKEKYVQSAIGWVLREMSKNHPLEVLEFVRDLKKQFFASTFRRATTQLPASLLRDLGSN